MARDPRFQLVYPFRPGDLVGFDNRRILHGRDAFESVGSRHLRGCYADHDDVYSKLRVLRRQHVHQSPNASRDVPSGAEGSAGDEAHSGASRTKGPTSPPLREVPS
jgi:gamma-butyrobetaine dioxygenase